MNCLSVTYKTVPVDIRARFAFTKEEKEEFINDLIKRKIVDQCVVLATCNRTELYFDGGPEAVIQVQKEFTAFKKMEWELSVKHFFVYTGERTIRHLYKVAAGIDSMVLGEDEILGQLKDAFFFARSLKATSYSFNTIFQGAITCAKKIKTATNLSKLSVSVGTLVAHQIAEFKTESKKNVMIIGITGKMGSIVMKNLKDDKEINLFGTVRSHSQMIGTLDQEITLVDYRKRYEWMEEMDIVVSVTASPHYTITNEELQRVLVSRKPRLFIDLAVPFDLDPEIIKIDGISLFNIDHFKQLSKANNESKKKEVGQAEDLMEEYIEEIKKTIEFHTFMPAMDRVKKAFETTNFEHILYRMRDQNSSEEFATILKALKQL